MTRLFSYGTLQMEAVQLAVFGRKVAGYRDELPGYTVATIEIHDPGVVEASGRSRHLIVRRSSAPGDSVAGIVLEITEDELKKSDGYETADYKRIETVLRSGRKAWVYVDAKDPE